LSRSALAAVAGHEVHLPGDLEVLPDVEGHQVACRMRATFGDAIFLVALTGYGGAENLRSQRRRGSTLTS